MPASVGGNGVTLVPQLFAAGAGDNQTAFMLLAGGCNRCVAILPSLCHVKIHTLIRTWQARHIRLPSSEHEPLGERTGHLTAKGGQLG